MKTAFAITHIFFFACTMLPAHAGDAPTSGENPTASTGNNATGITQRAKKFRLQYRPAADAIAPSSFLLITDDGGLLLRPLTLEWSLRKVPCKEAVARTKHKKEFDELIKKLEKLSISADFECAAIWKKPLAADGQFPLFFDDLVVLSVPQLTEKSREKLKRVSARMSD